MKAKIIKLLEENTGEKSSHCCGRQDFLNMTKSTNHEKKIDKLDFI